MADSYENRVEAGKILARALTAYKGRPDTLILALPRGGVPVAREVANALGLPLDVWIVRKLGVPGHRELAMGAIALGDVEYINHGVLSGQYVPDWAINQVIAEERQELARRNELYRQGRPPPSLKGKTALVVDDGLATGATMRAAILSLRQAGAVQIVAAVPVGAGAACRELEEADLVVCPWMPEPFYGVGQWYRDFSQTTDEQVQAILKERVEAAS